MFETFTTSPFHALQNVNQFQINHVVKKCITHLERDLSVKTDADIPWCVVLIYVELQKFSLSVGPSERKRLFCFSKYIIVREWYFLVPLTSHREIVSTWEQSSDWAPTSKTAAARPRFSSLNDQENDALLLYWIIYRIKCWACFCWTRTTSQWSQPIQKQF